MPSMENMQFEFNLRTTLKFGPGKAEKLAEELASYGWQEVGIILDKNIAKLPLIEKALKDVKKGNFRTILQWQYDIKGEPDYDSLDRIKKIFLSKNAKPLVECFVGIGGGSIIDFAKGLATVVINPGSAIDYRGFPRNIRPPLPVVAVPTIAGSGSEVTYNASFIDWASKKKLGINSLFNFPRLVIIDPILTLSCPKQIAIASAMDALVHTLESYAAQQANQLTRVFAREAFKLVFNNLPKLIAAPKNLEVRGNLQLGAYLAGISLCNSGSGPAGALSYPLGVHFKVGHGLAGAVFLPYLIEYNITHGYDYSELHDLIQRADVSLPKKRKNDLFSQKLFNLTRKLGIPAHLREFGVNERNASILLNEVDNLANAFAQNPVPFSVEDGKNLLQRMINPH